MKILVLGSSGQVASHLREKLVDAEFWDRSTADFEDPPKLRRSVASARPDIIINAAAYTAVDRAEDEPELAAVVNGEAPAALAQAASECGACLIHFSTDYVFAGDHAGGYLPTDETGPTSVYGRTKLAGEEGIAAHCDAYWIFRVSWVFSEYGSNFVKTMLRLAGDQDELRVVDDQFGRPTYAGAIAQMCLQLTSDWTKGQSLPHGIHHFAGGPIVSWHQFAQEIFRQAGDVGLLTRPVSIKAVSTGEYPTRAPRPNHSALSMSPELGAWLSFEPDWTTDLSGVLKALR